MSHGNAIDVSHGMLLNEKSSARPLDRASQKGTMELVRFASLLHFVRSPNLRLGILGIAAFACSDSDPGLNVRLQWPDGRPQFERNPFLFFEVMLQAEATPVRVDGPTPLVPGSLEVLLPGLPVDTPLVLRARVQAAPYRNARVLYIGEGPVTIPKEAPAEATIEMRRADGSEVLPDGPAPPDPNRISFVRRPWGRAGNVPEQVLTGQPGAAEPGVRVVVFDGPDLASASVLRDGLVARDGSFSISLASDPLGTVFVAATEGSGLASDQDPTTPGLRGTEIRRVEWTAAFGGKESGSTFRNPHRVVSTGNFDASLIQASSSVVELSGEEYARLFRGDAPGPQVRPTRRWLRPPESTAPENRAGAAMAFDPVRGRTVLFGGFGEQGNDLADTWEWDGRRWRRVEVLGGVPTARSGHGLVFSDPAEAVLLFGGGFGDRVLRDLWSFDGVRWTRLGEGPADIGGYSAQSAFDSSRRRLVVFGGCRDVACADLASGTWVWDGQGWRRLEPRGTEPPARRGGCLAPLADGTMLLVGGEEARNALATTSWVLDGDTWSEVSGATPPGRRFPSCATRDDDVLLFGGLGTSGAFNDVWRFSRGTWTPEPSPSSPSVPDRRFQSAAAYDRHREAMAVFSGAAPTPSSDTWLYRPGRWTAATGGTSETGGTRKTAAGPSEAASAYLPDFDAVVLHGGRFGRDVSDVMRVWSEGRWIEVSVGNGPRPSGRWGHSAAYDPRDRRMYIFGGSDADGVVLDETWSFSFETFTWSQLPTPTALVARRGHAMAYSPDLGGTVLFGGEDRDRTYGDTWLLTEAGWQLLYPESPSRPEPRAWTDMAHDATRSRILLYGGTVRRSPAQGGRRSTDDTWELTATGWARIGFPAMAVRPPPLSRHRVIADEIGDFGVVGGCTFLDGTCLSATYAVWLLSAGEWLDLTPRTSPLPSLYGHIAEYRPFSSSILVYGGIDGTGGGVVPGTHSFQQGAWMELRSQRARPAPRLNGRVAHDPGLDRTILYGGCTGLACSQLKGATWEWNGFGWERLVHETPPGLLPLPPLSEPALAPVPGGGLVVTQASARWTWDGAQWRFEGLDAPLFLRARGAFDPAGERTLLFGNTPTGFAFAELNASGIRNLPISGAPERFGVALAFDTRRNRLVAYGGCETEACQDVSDALVEWSTEGGWQPVPKRDPWPPPVAFGAAGFDAASGRTVLVGGLSDRLRPDVWEWDGNAWERVEIVGEGPAARVRAAGTFDGRRDEFVLFGGFVDGQTLEDTWLLPTGAGRRAGFIASFDLEASGLDLDRVAQLEISGAAQPAPQVRVWRSTDSRWVTQATHRSSPSFTVNFDSPERFREIPTPSGQVHVAILGAADGRGTSVTLEQLELVVTTE